MGHTCFDTDITPDACAATELGCMLLLQVSGCGHNHGMTHSNFNFAAAAAAVDEDASRASGSEAGGAQSDFQRGRRLRKLARMLNSKPAQKVCAIPSDQHLGALGEHRFVCQCMHLLCHRSSLRV
jgi:hypothetical protein